MSVKLISTTCVAIALATCTLTLQADEDDTEHKWMPKQPTNNYWQAPTWSGFSMPPKHRMTQPAYRPPMPPAYRQPRPAYNYPPQNAYRQNMNRAVPPAQNTNRGYPPPPPAGPYRGAPPSGPYRGAPYYGPNSGPSAFNAPGYNPYRRHNRGWNNNKFWGRSGPSTWMNPNKDNWERGWDDMINTPSRMGEMPGGWTAPEVTMPNPIDMGDQMQDNVKDLPEQIKNMDVGNDVN